MRRYILVCALLTGLVLGAASLTVCGNKPGTVQGTVTRKQDGKGIAQATIAVWELTKAEEVKMDVYQKGILLQKQFTDENGAYSVSLPPATYQFEVWVEGIGRANRLVEVKAGRTITVDFEVDVPPP